MARAGSGDSPATAQRQASETHISFSFTRSHMLTGKWRAKDGDWTGCTHVMPICDQHILPAMIRSELG
jgi:hypothetical protein